MRKNPLILIVTSILIFLVVASISPIIAAATSYVYSCGQSLTNGTTYFLYSNLLFSSPGATSCLTLGDDVILDLNGYTITAVPSGGNTYTIFTVGDNATIRNGILTDIDGGASYSTTGIYAVASASNTIIENVNITSINGYAGTGSCIYTQSPVTIDSVYCNNTVSYAIRNLIGSSNISNSYFFSPYQFDIDGNSNLILASKIETSAATNVEIDGDYANISISNITATGTNDLVINGDHNTMTGCVNLSKVTDNGVDNSVTNSGTCTVALGGGYADFISVEILEAPATLNVTDDYYIYVNVTGGTAPFNVSFYTDGRLRLIRDLYDDENITFPTSSGGGDPYYFVGNHTAYVTAVDFYGQTRSSNVVEFEVLNSSVMSPVSSTITPTNGTKSTVFHAQTDPVNGSYQTYTVTFGYWGNYQLNNLVTCSGILENGVCNGYFTGADLPYADPGYVMIWCSIRDSQNHYQSCGINEIYLNKSVRGDDLEINLTIDPVNGDDQTETRIGVQITGGAGPYKVVFYKGRGDWLYQGIPICIINETYDTAHSIYIYPPPESEYTIPPESTYSVYVVSDDGQTAVAHENTTVTGVKTPYLDDIVYIRGPPECSIQPGIIGYYEPEDCSSRTGLDRFICIIASPVIIFTAILIGVAVWLEKMSKTNGKVFALVVIIGTIILAYFDIYPIWVPIIFIIIGGLVAFKFFSGRGD